MGNNKKDKRKGLFGVAIVFVIALVMVIMIAKRENEDGKVYETKQQQLQTINTQIEQAKVKNEEIKNEIKYQQTDDYYKEEITEIFGLHDPKEVIFKAEDLEAEAGK